MLTEPARRSSTRSTLAGVALGVVLLLALNTLVVTVARALDPGAPLIMISNLAASFIGALQLLWGLPLALWQRRRRPALAAGMALGMAAVIVVNAVALYQ
jgi:hypothetical protein